MAGSPRIPSPLRTHCQNIDTWGGSKLHFTLIYQTLCPFELLIPLEGGFMLDMGLSSGLFTSSLVVVPVEPICGWLKIVSLKLFPVSTAV